MNKANFQVDLTKCNGCGICLNVCPGNMVGGDVLRLKDDHVEINEDVTFSWKGCWRCEHCLAACPKEAISILGLTAKDVPIKPNPIIKDELPKLISYRRSCRSFKDENVNEKIIDEMMETLSNVPTGGNNHRLEYSVIYDKKVMVKIHDILFPQLKLFDDKKDLLELRLYSAPHLFIAHKDVGDYFKDGDLLEMGLATAYFELLANSYGLGTIISTYAAELLTKSKEVREILNIPSDHRFLSVVGFGYPKINYARGIKKNKRVYKIK